MKKFARFIGAFLALVMVFSSNLGFSVNAANVDDDYLDFTLSADITLSRGFQIVNGNIHDRHGNLFLEIDDNGYTPHGTRLASDFSIIYAVDLNIEEDEGSRPSLLRNTDHFNGSIWLDANTNGNQSITLVDGITLSSSEPTITVRYGSGTISGVNFGVTNTTRNTDHTWVSNLGVGKTDSTTYANLFNSSRQNDKFRVRASGQGGSGNVNLVVRSVK